MTKKERLLQGVDERVDKTTETKGEKTKLATLALTWALTGALAIWAPIIWSAQVDKTQDKQDDQKEFVIQDSTLTQSDSTISWEDATKQVESDGEWDTTQTTVEKWSKFSYGWMIQVWSGVAADVWAICSDKPELTMVFDVRHKMSWLWISLVRLDDFSKDMSQPCSQATIIDPYLTKEFWPDWKLKLTIDWKYTIIDKAPELSWFAPDLKLAYSDKGWTFECMYIHQFKQKQDDIDIIRLWITKKIDKIFEITTQWWYEIWAQKPFSGRVILRSYLWHGFIAEFSCIRKGWKLSPTGWIIYAFQK